MKTLGWILTLLCGSVGLAGTYMLFYQPKSDCAAAMHELRERLIASSKAMATLRSLPRDNTEVSLKQMLPWLKGDLPVCPDGGWYLIHVSTPAKNVAGEIQTHFHINCSEHQFKKW